MGKVIFTGMSFYFIPDIHGNEQADDYVEELNYYDWIKKQETDNEGVYWSLWATPVKE